MSMMNIDKIIKYKALISNLVMKDLKIRYKRSFLGFLWTMLNPLLMMLVLSVVFSHIFRFRQIENYPIFLISALLPWIFVSQTLVNSTQSVLLGGGLIRKIYIPKAIFPLTTTTSGLVNYLFSLLPLGILMAIFGVRFTPALLFLPVAVFVLYFFILGGALFLSALNVFFRDVNHITGIVMQMMFYLTPIIYPLQGADFIPERYHFYFKLNPFFYVVKAFRDPVYYGRLPEPKYALMFVLVSLLTLVVGWAVFHHLEKRMIHSL